MTNVLWRKYKDFSGCLIRGTDPIVPQDPSKHLSCAAWLTAEAEGPSYGFVQSYDGAGISAGLLHNVLVYPRDLSQGDLGLLVRRMLDVMGGSEIQGVRAFDAEMEKQGWTLSPDGKFRKPDGKLVSGATLRNWAAPIDGVVPRKGLSWDRAAHVATVFHSLFTAWPGRKVQEDFAIAWLARGNRAAELAVYRLFAGDDLDSVVSLPISALPPEIHVAMCVYHSFSVNSPAVAARCLENTRKAMSEVARDRLNYVVFAKRLIRELGTHGRDVWHDEPGDGNNRYDRTRVALWGREDLFPGGHDLMPRDL